jgi:hypothetical protein
MRLVIEVWYPEAYGAITHLSKIHDKTARPSGSAPSHEFSSFSGGLHNRKT